MSWGRFDDSVSISPKLGQLNDRERRVLGDGLWAYCARERNGGYFDHQELRNAFYLAGHRTYRCTDKHLTRFVELGLVDHLGDRQYKVHNWEQFQPRDPTAADRKRKQRAKEQRDSHDRDDRDTTGRDIRDSRARGPVPSRKREVPRAVALDAEAADERYRTALEIDLQQITPDLQEIP